MNFDSLSTGSSTLQPIIAMTGEYDDIDILADTVAGWGLDWRQLDHGPLTARVQQVETPSTVLARFSFNRKFHQRGTTPPGMRTLAILGDRSPDVEWRGHKGTSDHIVIFSTGGDFDFVSHPGFHGDTVSVAEERLQSVAESLGVTDLPGILPCGQGFLRADQRRLGALRRRLTALHSTAYGIVPSGHRAGSDVEFELITSLVDAVATSDGTALGSTEPALRSRALRLALDYIEARADEPPTIEDLCTASGVSLRTLEYAFRDRFGVTPKQYLQTVRLRKVRRDLHRFGRHAPISEIAASWGFWHMGQFAADYRRRFGELPSETLRRKRAE